MVFVGDALDTALRNSLKSRMNAVPQLDYAVDLDDVLKSIGASIKDSGGTTTFYGRDPIVKSITQYGRAASVALAGQAVLAAAIWKDKNGEGQDIHMDVRKALRRFASFTLPDETLNGYKQKAASDPENPMLLAPMFEAGDGKWLMPMNAYPRLRSSFTAFMKCSEDKGQMEAAIKKWKGADLEAVAEEEGFIATLCRPLTEIFDMPVYQNLITQELIKIEKIADSEPKPLPPGIQPLSGIKVLGMGHVIAGPGCMRALASHGADSLNVWRPIDWEQELTYNSAHIGLRSTWIDIGDKEKRPHFDRLAQTADVFVSNRRYGYIQKYGITAEEMAKNNPHIIHATVAYVNAAGGPWSKRMGFDQTTGAAYGLLNLEGTDERPAVPPGISVVCDYITGWLATMGVMQALRLRAKDGGAYKVSVALSRVTMWIMSMGFFDKQFAYQTAGSSDEHLYIPGDLFKAVTPCGIYQGFTDQVVMAKTPPYYNTVMVQRGSSLPFWL